MPMRIRWYFRVARVGLGEQFLALQPNHARHKVLPLSCPECEAHGVKPGRSVLETAKGHLNARVDIWEQPAQLLGVIDVLEHTVPDGQQTLIDHLAQQTDSHVDFSYGRFRRVGQVAADHQRCRRPGTRAGRHVERDGRRTLRHDGDCERRL